jgi:isoquinoline 1-oxidoreductase beta subunit
LKVDRRTLLIGGGVGVGLIVGYALWPRRLGSDLVARPGEQAFGNYIKVGRDGRVTVAVPQVETGQGVWTALPQVVADELGAAWETVAVEPAPIAGAYHNPLIGDGKARITAGSTSIRAFEQPMRQAAAVARAMLVGAAADRWNVDPRDCETADGFVLSGVRTFSFGELAEEAAGRAPPHQAPLRATAKGRLTGQPLQRLDGPAKSDGSMRFAGDVRLPDMLFAAVRLAPPGGKLTGYSGEAIRKVPGVRHIAARDGWLAVVADTWWAAERAVKAADARFAGERTAGDLRPLYEKALAGSASTTVFSRGDYDRLTRGSRPLAATYWAAPSQHLGLETLTATARVAGQAEVWAPTQAPGLAQRAASHAAGGEAIFYPMPVGDSAGRALQADVIPIAIALARETGRPVQLTLSQSASQNHDRPSAGALARMMALPGSGGITAAWKMKIATADGFGAALATLDGEAAPKGLGKSLDGTTPPYAFPALAIEGVTPALPFAAGYMRGSPQRECCFFTESFVDELAHAAGMEPLAFRMSMLGGNPRLARCLQSAAQLAGWDGGGRGSTMGIAGCSAFGSHIGLVATATIGADQRPFVHKLVAAVDCGRVVNPGLVIQQVESGLIWALAQATAAEPAWAAGMPRARALAAIGLPRLAGTPDILVHLLPASQAPGGVSGLGPAVLAPAVGNAIFAGSGRRVRSLPFDLMSAA